jgi:hypothetical protein
MQPEAGTLEHPELNRVSILLAAHALAPLGFKANLPVRPVVIRLVLKRTRNTARLYGCHEGVGHYESALADHEIAEDIERLVDRGLLKPIYSRERLRLPDGGYQYRDKFEGHMVTTDAVELVERMNLDPETRAQMHRAHCLTATDMYHIRHYAVLGSALEELEKLALMAEPEPGSWSYRNTTTIEPLPILSSYIDFSFRRCLDQGRLAEAPYRGSMEQVFNTGLYTRNLEPIYGLFTPPHKQSNDSTGEQQRKWYFSGFFRESDRRIEKFPGKPPVRKATFFDRPTDLLFDHGRRFSIEYDHVIYDHVERFPASMQGEGEDARKDRHQRLETAVRFAMIKLEQNHRTAIPQFYWPGRGNDPGPPRLQILLPLYLNTDKPQGRADLALVVDSHETGSAYTARTSLTLDMAYKNARLIFKPSEEWLDP